MAKKRVTRKQLLKEPDEFITTTGRLIEWTRENAKTLTYSAGALFGLVVIISVYSMVMGSRAKSAEAVLSQVIVKYQAELGDNQAAKALSAVQADLDGLINDYSGQPAGRMGRVLYGHYSLAGGAFDDAIRHYQGALKVFKEDPSLTNVILNGLGAACQQKGDYGQAITYYKEIIASAQSMLKDSALFNLGLLHGQMGETSEQQKMFEQLDADFPNSFYANLVREKIGG